MKRPRLNVFVELDNGSMLYSQGDTSAAWCTEVEITKAGELKLWQGLRIRVFHPPGEWKSYSVSLAAATHGLRSGGKFGPGKYLL